MGNVTPRGQLWKSIMEINYGNQAATKDVIHRVCTYGKCDGQYKPSLGCHCDQVKENYQQTGLEHTHSKD